MYSDKQLPVLHMRLFCIVVKWAEASTIQNIYLLFYRCQRLKNLNLMPSFLTLPFLSWTVGHCYYFCTCIFLFSHCFGLQQQLSQTHEEKDLQRRWETRSWRSGLLRRSASSVPAGRWRSSSSRKFFLHILCHDKVFFSQSQSSHAYLVL